MLFYKIFILLERKFAKFAHRRAIQRRAFTVQTRMKELEALNSFVNDDICTLLQTRDHLVTKRLCLNGFPF